MRDETLSLSKTHFELVVDEERALWVIDRESTNGVVIRRGTQRQTAVPGERTRVRMGDVLEIGDRSATVEVAS
ncbi:MAG: FHA domain-containing protein [Proteobacteria bacterium]|nr:FHA domain-containing protein [Pseudomonadota bacterium]